MLYYSKKSNLLIVLTISLVLALALVGCNGGNGNDETEGVTFKIGSAGYAEVEITGELAKAIIEEKTAHTVEHVKNMGLALSHEAVIGGDLDMYTSFTGTLFLGLMEQTLTDEYRDPEKVYQYVSDNYLAD
ncbi:MAG: hypothetical protein NUK65_07845, partial [Firmicutes bacterium]|nr:hypothetical protein [Bacillota bacterium]